MGVGVQRCRDRGGQIQREGDRPRERGTDPERGIETQRQKEIETLREGWRQPSKDIVQDCHQQRYLCCHLLLCPPVLRKLNRTTKEPDRG